MGTIFRKITSTITPDILHPILPHRRFPISETDIISQAPWPNDITFLLYLLYRGYPNDRCDAHAPRSSSG